MSTSTATSANTIAKPLAVAHHLAVQIPVSKLVKFEFVALVRHELQATMCCQQGAREEPLWIGVGSRQGLAIG